MSENRPIFLVGCPRSGTTLLSTMLHGHPRLAMPPETRFLLPAYRSRRAHLACQRREGRTGIRRSHRAARQARVPKDLRRVRIHRRVPTRRRAIDLMPRR